LASRSTHSYIAATAAKICRHDLRFGFTARRVVGYDLTVLIMGRSFPELFWRPPVKAASSFWRSGWPLSHHAAPLPDRQSRPRPPLAVASEQRARLVKAVAGEQQPIDVLAVLGPQLDLEEVAPVGD
jgi:hypothetical protein